MKPLLPATAVLFIVSAGGLFGQTSAGAKARSMADIENFVKTERPAVDPETRKELSDRMIEAIRDLPKNPARRAEFIRGVTSKDPELNILLPRYLASYMESLAEKSIPEGRRHRDARDGRHSWRDEKPNLPEGWELGVEMAKEVRRRNPEDPRANQLLGTMHYLQRNWREAFDRFRDAYRAGSRDPQMVASLAGAAYELGDYALAARIAREALALDAHNEEAMTVYQFSKDRASRVTLADAPVSFDSAAAPASVEELSRTAAATPRSAESPSQLSTQANPMAVRSAALTKNAADALRLKDYQAARELAGQAVTLNPQNAQAFNYRAMALTQMGQYPEAVKDASAALALSPGSAAALQTRSWAFSKQKQYRDGLQDAEATLSSDPGNAFAFENKAFALAGLGDRDGTLDALRRAATIDPRFSDQLQRAIQSPQDADLTLLFGESAGRAPSAAPIASRPKRFAGVALAALVGGLLIAFGSLHIVSATWREKMKLTTRRSTVRGAPSASAGPGASPSEGAFWTQYQLVKEIGLGGMGVVYEAVDRSLERRVAVKKMRDEIRMDPDDRRHFVAEARMVAQLHHPNIVDIYAIVEDAGEVYLVFEYVDGRTLEDVLKSEGPMGLRRAASIVKDMAAAVEHAHQNGIIHRDLKPSNVMLTADGRVKVMDFGVARRAKDVMTRRSNMTKTVAGTPPYMAPEQEQGDALKESDVYALGVCLYEMATGHLPFQGSGAAMLLNKINGKWIAPSRRSPSLGAAFDVIIARSLDPDPNKRFRTPSELARALDVLAL